MREAGTEAGTEAGMENVKSKQKSEDSEQHKEQTMALKNMRIAGTTKGGQQQQKLRSGY